MSDNAQLVLTPTVARVARRSLVWVVLITILVLVGVATVVFQSAIEPRSPMSATNPAPAGAQALVEVLRDQGVRVTVVSTLAAAEEAVGDPDETTLFFYDPDFVLSEEQVQDVFGLAHSIVALDPTPETLRLISPDIAPAGFAEGTAAARCDLDSAKAAERITVYGSGYRVLNDAADVDGCFDLGDDVVALVQSSDGATTYSALGASDALSNGRILEEGNAALGLNLLGADENLVWYLPSLDDYDTEIATPAELAPDIVVPISLLAFLVAFAAMLWRGRRLGPLVVENLPVVVRASETMRGRARLYERANARLHTLDSLRIGTIARLASACGLPPTATVDEVTATVAAIAGLQTHEVRLLLIDDVPTTDARLVALSDELLALEKRVADNLRPN